MTIISDAEVLLLGLVNEKPLYGYEIEKQIEVRNMRRWANIGFSTIYYSLNKLQKQGLISSRPEGVEGKPSRNVFSITKDGNSVLRQHITKFLSEINRNSPRFDIGLMNSQALSKAEFRTCLKEYSSEIDKRLSLLHETLKSVSAQPAAAMLISRSAEILNCEKKWIRETIGDKE